MNEAALDLIGHSSRRTSDPHHRHAVGTLLTTLLAAAIASAGVWALAFGGNALLVMVGALVLGLVGLAGAVHA